MREFCEFVFAFGFEELMERDGEKWMLTKGYLRVEWLRDNIAGFG